jgi:hypothetical protein
MPIFNIAATLPAGDRSIDGVDEHYLHANTAPSFIGLELLYLFGQFFTPGAPGNYTIYRIPLEFDTIALAGMIVYSARLTFAWLPAGIAHEPMNVCAVQPMAAFSNPLVVADYATIGLASTIKGVFAGYAALPPAQSMVLTPDTINAGGLTRLGLRCENDVNQVYNGDESAAFNAGWFNLVIDAGINLPAVQTNPAVVL